MSTIEQSIEVEVPVHAACNQWTRFAEFPRFMEGVDETRQLDDTRPRVMVQMDFVPEGIKEKIGYALGAPDRRVKADLERFKELIESRGHESGAWRGAVPPDAG